MPYGEGDCSFFFSGKEEKQSFLHMLPPLEIKVLGCQLEVENAMSRERIEMEHSKNIDERDFVVRRKVATSKQQIVDITKLHKEVETKLNQHT